MEYNYKCPNCGSENILPVPVDRRYKIICFDCNSFITFASYSVVSKIYRELERHPEKLQNGKIGIKKVKKGQYSNARMTYCPACNCLLNNSCMPRPEGQFDLAYAKYCPKCGLRLI